MIAVMRIASLIVFVLNRNVIIDGFYFSGLQTLSGTLLSRPRSTYNFANSRTLLSSKNKRGVSDDDSQLVLDTQPVYLQVPNSSKGTSEVEKIGRADTGAADQVYTLEVEPKDALPTLSPLASKSFLLLNSVAIIWGTQHVVIKSALENFPSPSVLNFWRFALSFLLFLPAFVTVMVSMSFRMSLKSNSADCI